ncbi:hypothetical protein N7491_008873 [Penicillium cf. griseofulvum]|uniref:Uncharacterized protein n=1 Tax=Penicillium cf. griseofulvum TaxID=2972120 RepID=A0A9W9JUH1_9EURO|nr:hypothetical protein N7472_005530 [Penicillium cf. griseofulvum]KAJ5423657.1 hypothetical protein N7491_008873 [Penicillium cf. griseofulvum]KAJ5431090.1 hypothetical protein N7445_008822 [Penicillium cf. griseofulvum]
MRFASALFVTLSASFVVAVPVSSPNDASAAYWFNKAYEGERSSNEDGASAFQDNKTYLEN